MHHLRPATQLLHATSPKFTMPAVAIASLKKLRERTGASLVDCKKALDEADGDIEAAYKALKKAGHVPRATETLEGIIAVHTDADYGSIVEVNCQTDFVAKNEVFIAFVDKVAKAAFDGRVTDIDALKHSFDDERGNLIAMLGESINLRRVAGIEGETIAGYTHHRHIAALVSTAGASPDLSKRIAMHVAASKPEYLHPEDVPADVVKVEYERQLLRETESGGFKEVAEDKVKRSVTRFTAEVSLTGQAFVMDAARTVGEVLKMENARVLGFVCYEVGEAARSARK